MQQSGIQTLDPDFLLPHFDDMQLASYLSSLILICKMGLKTVSVSLCCLKIKVLKIYGALEWCLAHSKHHICIVNIY